MVCGELKKKIKGMETTMFDMAKRIVNLESKVIEIKEKGACQSNKPQAEPLEEKSHFLTLSNIE